MAQPGRRSDVYVERLQITLAKDDADVLDRIVRIGKFGRNRNEAAARIIGNWLHDSAPAELRAFLGRLAGLAEFDARVPSNDEGAGDD